MAPLVAALAQVDSFGSPARPGRTRFRRATAWLLLGPDAVPLARIPLVLRIRAARAAILQVAGGGPPRLVPFVVAPVMVPIIIRIVAREDPVVAGCYKPVIVVPARTWIVSKGQKSLRKVSHDLIMSSPNGFQFLIGSGPLLLFSQRCRCSVS